MAGITYLTREGFEKIKQELEELRTNGRKEAARQIAEAREKGDLSENAEYDAAKEAQGMLELKISTLESTLASTRILDTDDLDFSKVTVLSHVKIKNLKDGKEMDYKIVSETEADVKARRISVSSPIGKGLLGKARGEVAEVQTPAGIMKFEVLDIYGE